MTVVRQTNTFICARCLFRQSGLPPRRFQYGQSSTYSTQAPALPPDNEQSTANEDRESESHDHAKGEAEKLGAMSRRLAHMTEESIEHGGRGAKKAIEEGGFSEELKRQLGARIQDSAFRSENSAAFAELNMPSSAGKGTRDVAAAEPWSGNEKMEDAALRMLDDAHKPLRGFRKTKIPLPQGTQGSVDMRMKKAIQRSQGERLANARDRTSVYALTQDSTLSEKEREQMRKTLKERFTAGARPMPGSVSGLAALANERIEDAIARGQFKNIARGKGKNVERDYNANSPFLDTTEYFMNKIIQKQEIVPPWIEKQQELVKAAAVFRGRLRNDWKRHAARVIASTGGSLEAQVQRAEAYAAAEAAMNPKKVKKESLTEIDHEGKLSQLTVTETPISASAVADSKITITEELPEEVSSFPTGNTPHPDPTVPHEEFCDESPTSSKLPDTADLPLVRLSPFRDPAWQSLEYAYHSLAIKDLNNTTRTYNLQAPDLAKKPYFSLDRELRSCFADIAPMLPDEIRDRARRPEKIQVKVVGHRPGGVLDKFSADKVKVYDSRKPNYGFKQFWNELWGSSQS